VNRALRFLVLASLAALASACTTTKVLQPEIPHRFDAAQAKILIMPLDLELYELEAGGVTAPRADWTHTAREHLGNAIARRVQRGGAQQIPADEALLSAESPHLQLFKLHEATGEAIFLNQAGGANGQLPVLPTLRSGFDWSLGESVQSLAAETDANYALFVFVRDSYATAGRKAAMVGALLVCGVTGVCMPVGTGVRIAFASLVDLHTGRIVWFNRLYTETGDLREGEPAAKATEVLLKDFPL
jgi:hypothetical protein